MTNDQRPTTSDPQPTIVGLTGGIGSGKSTIANELARRGYVVYDCDREAKRIIALDRDVQTQIIHLLGEESFVNGKYNTKYVAARVFSDHELMGKLNAIVHPAVKRDIIANGQRLTANSFFFIESAILYEAGLDRLCDRVVYVDAPEAVRVARTVVRDHSTREQVLARIHAQHTTPHKNAIVLSNDGTRSIASLADEIISRL